MIKIVILGAGNVGTHLFRVFTQAKEVHVVQWYNRSPENLKQHQKDVAITGQLDHLMEADVYLLALSDDAIPITANELATLKGIVAHTAGSVPMDALKQHTNRGVFYPLQTFSKNRVVDFKSIPICIEANSDQNRETLTKLAEAIGENIHYINSTQRMGLHTAAVYVNNFTNHLYQVGAQICEEQEVPFDLLRPLIAETAVKIESITPKEAQTGPALRNDKTTLQKHMDQLSNPVFKNLYLTLTESIQKNDEYSKL